MAVKLTCAGIGDVDAERLARLQAGVEAVVHGRAWCGEGRLGHGVREITVRGQG